MAQKDCYDQRTFPRLRQALKALPDTPPEPNTAKGMVQALREDFERKLAGGWTYEQLATLMSEQGIKITAKTLGTYLKAIGLEASLRKSQTRKRRPHRAAASSKPNPLSRAAANPHPPGDPAQAPPADPRPALAEPPRRSAFFNEDN